MIIAINKLMKMGLTKSEAVERMREVTIIRLYSAPIGSTVEDRLLQDIDNLYHLSCQ